VSRWIGNPFVPRLSKDETAGPSSSRLERLQTKRWPLSLTLCPRGAREQDGEFGNRASLEAF
jgi:hypothetical protein